MKSNMKDCSPVRCHVVYRGASITSIDRSWLIKKKKIQVLGGRKEDPISHTRGTIGGCEIGMTMDGPPNHTNDQEVVWR